MRTTIESRQRPVSEAPPTAVAEHHYNRRAGKNPSADLKRQYHLSVEIGLVASLLVLIGVFHAPIRPSGSFDIVMAEQEVVALDDIQQTKQIELPPPPPRPQVPIAVADETQLEDFELDLDAALDLDEPLSLPAPPPPAPEKVVQQEDEEEIFVVVEEMPEIIGGTAALYALIEYPELARRAGVEGLVVVQIVIEADGVPSTPNIARSAGTMLDEAAVKAVMALLFTPGRQRTRPVRVRVAIPVRFKLRTDARVL